MTDPLFLAETLAGAPLPAVGAAVELGGPEGHHAAAVRRIRVGETVLLADGAGRAVRGPVTAATKQQLTVEVAEQLTSPEPALRITLAQALAKGDRAELAVEMATELGVSGIWPWQSARAVVRWSGDRAEKSRARWQSTVREATKQSRRFRVPPVEVARDTRALAAGLDAFDAALVLHEDAALPLAGAGVPRHGSVLLVVGPEGGIAPEELDTLTAAGARTVSLGDGVLRTSTAGVVAMAGLLLR
ncbi:16S rRNA (uracil1498-N3)-methyltransferase [Friedmanniella endophytica]|uniref:Ribosomal RNA small subunit methyltransferase E n=1 Tax=Microlunatus kandeliicorticis TaxID=1759536 RepID=A0A7W3P7B3_9ACTN|nr:16S rRNA (uracil(1498)-N(3))-methyltransferase [Microlunatus kandeliicorticis]MBA8795839.1 16S rRNA (uracil1498-N3)-methyltransferase [Microlunatus kandeliicorticis]